MGMPTRGRSELSTGSAIYQFCVQREPLASLPQNNHRASFLNRCLYPNWNQWGNPSLHFPACPWHKVRWSSGVRERMRNSDSLQQRVRFPIFTRCHRQWALVTCHLRSLCYKAWGFGKTYLGLPHLLEIVPVDFHLLHIIKLLLGYRIVLWSSPSLGEHKEWPMFLFLQILWVWWKQKHPFWPLFSMFIS